MFVIGAKRLEVNKAIYTDCHSGLIFNWRSIVTARYQACGQIRAKFASFGAKIEHTRLLIAGNLNIQLRSPRRLWKHHEF